MRWLFFAVQNNSIGDLLIYDHDIGRTMRQYIDWWEHKFIISDNKDPPLPSRESRKVLQCLQHTHSHIYLNCALLLRRLVKMSSFFLIIFILAILIIISESGRGLSSFWSCPCSHLRTKQHLASPHWSELLVVKSLTRTMKKMTAGPQPCPCRSALHMRRFQALRKLRRERRWTMQSRRRERTSLKTGKTGREKTSKSSGWDCGLGSSLLGTPPPPSHLWRWTRPGPPSPHQKQQNSGEKTLCPLPSSYFGFPCLLQ